MADPLSIAASVITLLETVHSLYDFISRIRDAPIVLKKANRDLKATVDILKDLQKHIQKAEHGKPAIRSLLNQESALSTVLSSCRTTCKEFNARLDSCVNHSDSNTFSFRDRLVSVLKEKDIAKFREEIRSERDIISLRIAVLNFLTSSESHTVLVTLQQITESAADKITQKLQGLEVVLNYLERTFKASEEAKEEQVRLAEQLRVCKGNMSASPNSAAQNGPKDIDQEWGNTTLTRSVNMQGATGKHTNVRHKWRDTDIQNGSNVQGMHTAEAIGALDRVESTRQQQLGSPTTEQFLPGIVVLTENLSVNQQGMPQQPQQPPSHTDHVPAQPKSLRQDSSGSMRNQNEQLSCQQSRATSPTSAAPQPPQ